MAFEEFPANSTDICVMKNIYSRCVDLQHHPDGLQKLQLDWNAFSGTVCLRSLPDTLDELHLSCNWFSEWTDFSPFPQSLSWLYVDKTHLEGEICARSNIRVESKESNVKIIETGNVQ